MTSVFAALSPQNNKSFARQDLDLFRLQGRKSTYKKQVSDAAPPGWEGAAGDERPARI